MKNSQNVAIPKPLAADLAAKAGQVSLSLNKFVELALTAFIRTGCNLTPIFSRPDPVPLSQVPIVGPFVAELQDKLKEKHRRRAAKKARRRR
jgi:hypothetical protein